jgi:hypothetical protein
VDRIKINCAGVLLITPGQRPSAGAEFQLSAQGIGARLVLTIEAGYWEVELVFMLLLSVPLLSMLRQPVAANIAMASRRNIFFIILQCY